MPSGVFNSILLKHMWGTDELRAIFNDENRVQKWFDYEAALALAQAELGIIPQAAAAEIAAKAKVANVDLAGDCRRDPPHQAPAGAGAARACRRSAPTATANTCISARPPRTCSTPAWCCRSSRRMRSSCATSRTIGRELYRLAERTRPRRWPAAPTGAGAADHLRPQMRDLARRDRPQLRAPARNWRRATSSAAWSAPSAPRRRSATHAFALDARA